MYKRQVHRDTQVVGRYICTDFRIIIFIITVDRFMASAVAVRFPDFSSIALYRYTGLQLNLAPLAFVERFDPVSKQPRTSPRVFFSFDLWVPIGMSFLALPVVFIFVHKKLQNLKNKGNLLKSFNYSLATSSRGARK